MKDFRHRLAATLRGIAELLDIPGVLVVGSQVPNLLEPEAASTLVVSRDVDVGVPVDSRVEFGDRLRSLDGFRVSEDEPAVRVPDDPEMLEVNFVGLDGSISEPSQTYLLDDPVLPLMVFGPLGLLEPGGTVRFVDVDVPVPRVATLMIEKLVTDRSAEKGARDLLVVAGLMVVAMPGDEQEMVRRCWSLPGEMRYAIRSNLSVLSLMDPLPGMPDPRPLRARIAALLERIEAGEADRP